jgi:hypothetical protein
LKLNRASLIPILVLIAAVGLAQRRGGPRGAARADYQTARQASAGWFPVPAWTNPPGFEQDVFTFVRVRYESTSPRGWSGGGWATDFPESDLNISYRLQQITSLRVDPDGRVITLTDPELFHFPFIYIVEPGRLEFTEDEVVALRRYLLSGGFLMVDDFWGEREWANFHHEIKRVFPDREPAELPLEHPVFHCVFDLDQKPQIPSIRGAPWQAGITWERPDAREVHYKGLFDDRGRMMAIICHNTDLGDGWEEEATSPEYFRRFSEKYAYPLTINIIVYAMTH